MLAAIWDAIPTLATFPHRCPLAPENEFTRHTVRVLIVKKTLYLLFWVDDDNQSVHVEGFRHASQPILPLEDRL